MNKFFLQQISFWHNINYLNQGKWVPFTDIYETLNEFIIKVELSGMNKKDIDVTIEKNKLTICGTRKENNIKGIKSYYQVEINYDAFERVIFLPEDIDETSIKAEFENGFLTIIVKKLPTKKKISNVHLKIN